MQDQRALQEKMFGPMKPISREDYFRIYKETGIDIDGRREMVTNMVPAIEKSIKKLIVFAKVLPGFKDFHINDQIALIKGNIVFSSYWKILGNETFPRWLVGAM